MNARLFSFVGGASGAWQLVSTHTVTGAPLAGIARLDVVSGALTAEPEGAQWVLRGLTSNERYVTRAEKDQLLAKQPPLARPEASCAAFIAIRKRSAWWGLTQDERRKIFEDSSQHIATGLRFLPQIARRLHHCRDLGENEPFDFLTWFEYAPADAAAFDDLLAALRASEEWQYVEREVDLRLLREV